MRSQPLRLVARRARESYHEPGRGGMAFHRCTKVSCGVLFSVVYLEDDRSCVSIVVEACGRSAGLRL